MAVAAGAAAAAGADRSRGRTEPLNPKLEAVFSFLFTEIFVGESFRR